MKRNKREERGITLVALVVTLVVLLILAGITIATLFGDNGVINKAQKAKDETEQAEKDETAYLNKNDKIEWIQKEDGTIMDEDGEMTLRIGDYVDYDCTTSDATYTSEASKSGWTGPQVFKANEYKDGWRVLGIDRETKQLELISEDLLPLTGGGGSGYREGQYYYLRGNDGYINGVDELNKICSIYGKGEGATGARTINVDDINWITGYNPNNTGVKDKNKTGSGTKCYLGQRYEYGKNVKYTLLSTGVKYEPENSVASETSYKKFAYYDGMSKTWKNLATNGSVTLKNSEYYYYPTTLTETDNKTATVGIGVNTVEYKMLFMNSDVSYYYWLGSQYVSTDNGFAFYGLRRIYINMVNGVGIGDSAGGSRYEGWGVRPVVTLNSKAMLKDSGTMKDGCKLYNLVI